MSMTISTLNSSSGTSSDIKSPAAAPFVASPSTPSMPAAAPEPVAKAPIESRTNGGASPRAGSAGSAATTPSAPASSSSASSSARRSAKAADADEEARVQTQAQAKAKAAEEKNEDEKSDPLSRGVRQMNETMQVFKRDVGFKIVNEDGDLYVEVFDKNTQTIIRHLPPEDLLDKIDRIKTDLGYIVDKEG